MKRRTFCAQGLAALTAASLPVRHASAALLGQHTQISAVGLDGRQLTLTAAEVQELRAALHGQLLAPGQEGYDSARRLWNAAFDKKPALIVRCADAADVQQAVRFASSRALLTAVRGGGHSLSGQSGCDGGLVIDVSPMRAVRIDRGGKLAQVQAGSLLGPVDRAAQEQGLATVLGTVADTGVAGLTLGGGEGRLSRKLGLTIDNLAAVELVTADGRALSVSASDNPDLYWALRGGGGNFGVVTSFSYRLHEIGPQLYGGTLTYPYADVKQMLRSYADICAHMPEELNADVSLTVDPEHQERIVEFDVCYCGPLEQAERAVAPLRKLGKPLRDQIAPSAYVKLQGSDSTPGVSSFGAYVKGGLVYGLTPALIDAMVDYIEAHPSNNFEIELGVNGGAIGRVAPQDTAFFGRGASHTLLTFSFWKVPGEGAEASTAWVRGAWAQLEPHTRGNYVNLASTDDRESRVHAAYGDNYARLASLKKRYDPQNIFRLNANIKPAA
ncbi:MAG TPA: FAD-binding oxidoreductase [Steroidobacteraceae bacterium]|jgi:FAD/FMN-containing dehydrogenase|nr:FAD-binding oxidoreductase [Steroidobacteraceae bacterium]